MRKESNFAIFEYEKCDQDLIDILSKYLDEHACTALDFFEVESPKNKILIKIIPTKARYDEYYVELYNLPAGTHLQGWMIGNYNYDKNQITYLSLHDFENTSHKLKGVPFDKAIDYYKKTIMHEFVHYANGLFRNKHNCVYPEKYLKEGIAVYLSRQNEEKKCEFNFTLEEVLNPNKNLYDAYFLLTKYFVENYDKKFVLKTFESSREGKELLEKELFDKAKNFYKNHEQEEKKIK